MDELRDDEAPVLLDAKFVLDGKIGGDGDVFDDDGCVFLDAKDGSIAREIGSDVGVPESLLFVEKLQLFVKTR